MSDVLSAIGELLGILGQSILSGAVDLWNFLLRGVRTGFIHSISEPFGPTAGRLGYIYLLSSLVIALIIYALWARKKRKALSLSGAFEFLFPKKVWSHPFAWLDVRYFPVTGITAVVIVLPIATVVSGYVYTLSDKFFSFMIPTPLLSSDVLTFPVIFGIAFFLAASTDFVSFLLHRLQHKWTFLWEFHKVHHSALAMHPLSNYREHFIDNVLYQPVSMSQAVFLLSFLSALFGFRPDLPTIFGVQLFAFFFGFVAYNLRHSHIWFAYKPYWLGYIFQSPAHHQIHHSKEMRHLDKNFGFLFSMWDWAFGSLYLPREREKFRIGLADDSECDYDSIWKILWVPFAKAFKFVPDRLPTKQPAE